MSADTLVAILADDLTGALDAAAPFAALGFTTCVATGPAHLAAALAERTQVVAVSTGSRDASPEHAAALAATAARQLREAGPVAFKKIDSRLKGQVAAEIGGALAGFGRRSALVCPAIPDLGRTVRDGIVQGFGVANGLPVAAALDGIAQRCEVPDAADDAALDALARSLLAAPADRLAVGARGLAAALARALAARWNPASRCLAPLPRPVLFGIGSRDPITLAQLAALRDAVPLAVFANATDGLVDPTDLAPGDILVCAMTDGGSRSAAAEAAQRFARGIAAHVAARSPATLVLSGGETAAAILSELGIGLLHVTGEIMPGLPFSLAHRDGARLAIVTKSGGFGGPETLLDLLGETG